MKNISRLFYKEYFTDLAFDNPESDKEKIKEKNQIILEAHFFSIPHHLQYKDANNEIKFKGQTIPATIQYPGLVTGTGINHEAKIEGEFKLGVHFDYTYGMPVIYGSSVKGLLRSAFPDSDEVTNREKDARKKTKRKKLREAKMELIKSYLSSEEIGISNMDIDALRDQIFEGIGEDEQGEKGSLSIYKRDVFFDAVIIEPYTKKNGKPSILESDSITPHVKKEMTYEQSMLKNPIPLTFLKIASGVKMEFRFDLKPTTIDKVKITDEQKKCLFEKILKDFGIGAKTNVGYGQFKQSR